MTLPQERPRKPRRTAASPKTSKGRRAAGSATSKAPLAVRSRGQRVLAEVPLSAASIGRVIGSAGVTVTAYRRGEKTPSSAARRALEQHFGIDVRAWDELPVRAPPKAAPAVRSGTARANGSAPPDPESPAPTASVEAIVELLDSVRTVRRDGSLLASERLKAGAEERALLAMLHRVQAQAATFEDSLCRLPAWRRVVSELKDILLPHREVHAEICAWLSRRHLEEQST